MLSLISFKYLVKIFNCIKSEMGVLFVQNEGSVIVHLLSLCLCRCRSMGVKSIRAKVEAQGSSSSNSCISKRIPVFIKLAELLKEIAGTCCFSTAARSYRKYALMGLLTLQ